MKLELGGGKKPRGEGFANVDIVESADVVFDLRNRPWPFADDSVTEIYSSHFLEHVEKPLEILEELCRVCCLGAPVEIRVPHPAAHLAMIADHKHVFSPIAAMNMETYHPKEHWTKPKRLKLEKITYGPSILLEEAKRELPFLTGVSDEAILKFIAGTCHESCFFYTVVVNEHLT